MKGAVLILWLLMALFQSSWLFARPSDRLPPPEIQAEAVETGPWTESQDAVVRPLDARLKRETPMFSKTPARFCTGCFSVIGDPTRPQQ